MKIKCTRDMLETLQVAVKLFNLSVAETIHITTEQLFQAYIIKQVYLKIEKKIIYLIETSKGTATLKLDRVQCIALYKAMSASGERSMLTTNQAIALDNFLLELGQAVPHTILATHLITT